MPLNRIGGLAALICALTYVIGFALLLTALAPLDYGTNAIDADRVVAFIQTRPGILIVWNTVIYIVNGVALLMLGLALSSRLRATRPAMAQLAHALGLIWVTLVLGAGMIANVAIERVLHLAPDAPQAAATLWATLHAVELGLGGGNETVGGLWAIVLAIAGWHSQRMPRAMAGLGLIVGLSGLATIVPAIGDVSGAVFGLGMILWFLLTGLWLLRTSG